MNDTLILLDMDGVLVDFVGGAYRAHGAGPPESPPWSIWEPLGLTEAEFWRPLGREFWAGLDWTQEGRLLVRWLTESVGADRVALLSSPCETEGCAEGKLDWIKKHAPQFRRQYLLGPAKRFAAGPGRLLIDDHEPNVIGFRKHGGRAVLVPRPWNSRRGECVAGRFSVDDLLAEVSDVLDGRR